MASALLSHVAPHGISAVLGNQLGRLETLRLVVDFRSSRARSGRVGHHVGFVSRPSQPWILHRRENIRETRELQIAASRDAGRASPREAAPIENGGTCKATSPHHSCQMPQLVLASLAPVDPSDTKMDPVKPAARGKGNQRVAGQARPIAPRAKLSNPSVQQLGRLQGSGQRPGSPRGAIQRCAWRRP